MEQKSIQQDAGANAAQELVKSGATYSEVDTGVMRKIAKMEPRNLKAVQGFCLEESEMAGDVFYYEWPMKSTNKKTGEVTESFLSGASVHCVQAALKYMGNFHVQQLETKETATAWIFTTRITDMETNFAYERQFRMAKNAKVHGGFDAAKKDDVRYAIGQSKSIRNTGKPLVPIWMLNAMVEVAKKSAKGKIEKLIADYDHWVNKEPEKYTGTGRDYVINQITSKLEGLYGVTYEDQKKRANGIKKADWNIEVITRLAGDLTNLITGQVKVEDLYPPDDADNKKSDKAPPPAPTPGNNDEHQEHANAKHHDTEKKEPEKTPEKKDDSPAGLRQQIGDAAKNKALTPKVFNAWLLAQYTFSDLGKVPPDQLDGLLQRVKKLTQKECIKIGKEYGK